MWFYISPFECSVKSVSVNFLFFCVISRKIAKIKGIGRETIFHNLQLKWNMIPWNAKDCFWAWIFCECEFTEPSLVHRLGQCMIQLRKQNVKTYPLIRLHLHMRLLMQWPKLQQFSCFEIAKISFLAYSYSPKMSDL